MACILVMMVQILLKLRMTIAGSLLMVKMVPLKQLMASSLFLVAAQLKLTAWR